MKRTKTIARILLMTLCIMIGNSLLPHHHHIERICFLHDAVPLQTTAPSLPSHTVPLDEGHARSCNEACLCQVKYIVTQHADSYVPPQCISLLFLPVRIHESLPPQVAQPCLKEGSLRAVQLPPHLDLKRHGRRGPPRA